MRIAEVSQKYDISADTLRYYERIGLLPHIRRTSSGVRDYGQADLARVEFIKCMRSAAVLTLPGGFLSTRRATMVDAGQGG